MKWLISSYIKNNNDIDVYELKCPRCGFRITVTRYMIDHDRVSSQCNICDSELEAPNYSI